MLSYIDWQVSPLAFEIGPISYQWYGILFMTGIWLSYQLVAWLFKQENIDTKNLFNAALVIVIGVIVGARLGEVFFYSWDYFSQHLDEIPMIWLGGLASHGAIIGIIITSYIAVKYRLKVPALWFADRMVMASCVASGFIRLGNLMNHEIIGKPTEVPWAFVFHNSSVDLLPRHPAQLYEVAFFGLIFLILGYMYLKTNAKTKPGLLAGWFFILMPAMRIFVEFFKHSQGGFESSFGNVLSTGQLLSIPFIFLGIALIVWSWERKKAAPTTD
ncbi:MAG: prolipoprotein diacylglyceryl transferase [Flavobacteriales bacterium]|nr:prolipoprotein diacylglyceryl transferase [Flavobacteriales bacterium]